MNRINILIHGHIGRMVFGMVREISYPIELAFARPYPMAISGKPEKLTFDLWTKSFRFEYYPDLNISKEHAKEYPTEIAVPEMQYPNESYKVNASEWVEWRVAPYNRNIIQVLHDPSIMSEGQLIFIE